MNENTIEKWERTAAPEFRVNTTQYKKAIMLISPPFLTEKTKDSEILETGLKSVPARVATTDVPEGNYPVSQSFLWHTGMHLQSPATGTGHAPVRAVADGKIIFVSPPRAKVDDATDGQAYNPFGSEASWTDNGMVIIEHTTEIGAAGDVATSVVYYSSYMHLSEIEGAVTVGKQIYRKDVLGKPGLIYNEAGQIELSISFEKENLKKLIGREPEWLAPENTPTKDGRTDAIFGNIYCYLPATTPINTGATMPTMHVRSTYNGTEVLGTAQWIKINYGNDSVSRGDCVLSSYSTAGEALGDCATESTFEYKLHKEATSRHASQPGTAQSSSASGWYELMRFGRNIGRGPNADDKDPLHADAIHWRKIKTAAGAEVWADLNAEGSYKFSDADFLPLMGWNCYHDDVEVGEQLCNSAKLKSLIADPLDPESQNDNDKLVQRVGNAEVLPKLARTICKFPNEWDKATLGTRYKFISERPEMQENPDNWNKAKKHLETMGMSGLPDDFKKAEWHFHPGEFIKLFSKCGWLNNMELAQCFPRVHSTLNEAAFENSTVNWATVLPRATLWALPFNRATRKYGIANSKQRLVHFFAHVIPETGFLRLMKEGDNASGTYLQGKPYYPYYGRGLIQLTWLAGYKKYGDFRGFANTILTGQYSNLGWNPDTMIALSNTSYNAENCADSACFYVASHATMVKKIDIGIAQSDAVAVGKCVNGDVAIQNLNGLEVRLQCVLFLRDALLSMKSDAATETMSFSWRRKSHTEPVLNAQGQPTLNSSGQVIKKFYLRETPWTIQVNLAKQRP